MNELVKTMKEKVNQKGELHLSQKETEALFRWIESACETQEVINKMYVRGHDEHKKPFIEEG